jgi:cytochrome c553
MKILLGVAASLLMMTSLHVAAEGDPVAGQQKSATCAACHGTDGNSVVPMWPKIAGQHEAYLNRHITLIRDGARMVPEMMGIVAILTDEDIADLSAFYASQSISPGTADESLVPLGQQIYRAGIPDKGVPSCAACHGPAGEGNPYAGYPWIAAQHATYTASMLTKYRDGQMWGDDDANSAVMVGVANRLTDAEIAAVASYIEGLYRPE